MCPTINKLSGGLQVPGLSESLPPTWNLEHRKQTFLKIEIPEKQVNFIFR